MSRPGPGTGPARFLLCLVVLATAGLVLFAGCTTSPGGGQGQPAVTATTPQVPSYVVYVPGRDSGTLILIGRSTCPWCQKTKELLANLSVGYYWIDLNTLDQAQTTEVMAAVKGCSRTDMVPILLTSGGCIVGYDEQQIRKVVG